MNKKPFEEVYQEQFKPLYNYIYMQILDRELTEDIVSEAFLKAFKAYDTFSSKISSEKTWLFRIAKNLLIDHYRKAGVNHEYCPGDETLEAVAFDDKELSALEDDTNRTVYQVLSHLKAEEREIIIMRYIREMKNPEIAAELGIAAKAVSERIRRILAKCRKIMDEEHL